MALLEEQTDKITFTDDFTECTESKEWNQYQQSDDAGCNQLVDGPATEISQRSSGGPMVNEAHHNFLKGVQDKQQGEKGYCFVQRRPNEG